MREESTLGSLFATLDKKRKSPPLGPMIAGFWLAQIVYLIGAPGNAGYFADATVCLLVFGLSFQRLAADFGTVAGWRRRGVWQELRLVGVDESELRETLQFRALHHLASSARLVLPWLAPALLLGPPAWLEWAALPLFAYLLLAFCWKPGSPAPVDGAPEQTRQVCLVSSQPLTAQRPAEPAWEPLLWFLALPALVGCCYYYQKLPIWVFFALLLSAAWRTAFSLPKERERGALDCLLTTRLSASEYARTCLLTRVRWHYLLGVLFATGYFGFLGGWLQPSLVPRPTALFDAQALMVNGAVALAMLLAPLLGALLGLWVGAAAANRRQAGERLAMSFIGLIALQGAVWSQLVLIGNSSWQVPLGGLGWNYRYLVQAPLLAVGLLALLLLPLLALGAYQQLQRTWCPTAAPSPGYLARALHSLSGPGLPLALIPVQTAAVAYFVHRQGALYQLLLVCGLALAAGLALWLFTWRPVTCWWQRPGRWAALEGAVIGWSLAVLGTRLFALLLEAGGDGAVGDIWPAAMVAGLVFGMVGGGWRAQSTSASQDVLMR